MSRDRLNDRKLAEAIHAAAIHLLRIVRVEDTRAGIAPAQLSALSVLVFHGPATPSELAAIEQVKPPTMSRIVQNLVEQRLVVRKNEASDRRAVRLSATLKGRKLLLAGRDRRVRALVERLGSLNESDRAALRRAARLLAQI